MSKENTPTGFTDDQLRTVARAWAVDGEGMRMAKTFAKAVSAVAEAARHMDRFLSIAEQFSESIIPEVDKDAPHAESEEAGPTIAERLKVGDIDVDQARNLAVEVIVENIQVNEFIWLKPCRLHVFSDYKYIPKPNATIDFFKSGKANTGGPDANLRSDIKAILESEGFDVRC